MRRILATIVLLCAGCAATGGYRPLEIVAMNAAPRTTCYVQHKSTARIEDARLVHMGGTWSITGLVRASRTRPIRNRLVKVEAVDASECVVLATLSPAITTAGDRWTFELPIPDPLSFDHLHLAVVTRGEAPYMLPSHTAATD